MELVSMKELLVNAYENGYAVPAINVSNMETIMATLEQASKMKAPIILQVAPIQIEQQKIEYTDVVAMTKLLAKKYEGKYAIHQDHAVEVTQCIDAIESGVTSVMFDGSALSYEQNVDYTKQVREKANQKKVTLEAELGQMIGTEGKNDSGETTCVYTDPLVAKNFVMKTKVDALAVSIGNAHGFYKGKPKLDFKRLEQIKESIDIPMVLHGGTGIPNEDIQKAIEKGIAKINFFTEVDDVFTHTFAKEVEQNKGIYMMVAIERAREAMMRKIGEKIQVCMAEGRL